MKANQKKEIELYVLREARRAGLPIPADEICGEKPDFKFVNEAGVLGLELTELLRPASSNGGIKPVEEEAFHREVIALAEKEYYKVRGSRTVRARVYFANSRAKRKSKRELARALAEFVRANAHRANPTANLSGLRLPEGFGSMSIAAEPGDWWCGECGGATLSDIRSALAARISAKNKALPRYQANLPNGSPIWLLLYSGVAVSRSMPIPYGIEEWRFSFGFERVFWFASLEGQLVELRGE
jgi:hypothetical protein